MARIPPPTPPAIAAITAGVVMVAITAGILLQPTKDRSPPPVRGPAVSIAVVAPREPVPEPGGVMDVGELADGYTHRAYARPVDVRALPDYGYDDAPPPPPEPRRDERPRIMAPEPAPAPVIVERREPRRWSFGFDQPRPDYAAERRERIARREEQQRFEEARRRDRYEGPEDQPDWRDAPRPRLAPGPDGVRRERQWYRSDGRPVPGPDAYD